MVDSKTRNTYLGAAMLMEHVGEVCPGVIATANFVAQQDGFHIPYDVCLPVQDRQEIVKTAAETVYLARQGNPTELERLIMLHIVNVAVERDFLPAESACEVMSELTGVEPRNPKECTIVNWRSSLDSMVRFSWPIIEAQLSKLRDKAGQIVLRASDEIQHELADARAFWEQILKRHLDYVESKDKPTLDDAMIIYKAAADVAWQYKIEIATARRVF